MIKHLITATLLSVTLILTESSSANGWYSGFHISEIIYSRGADGAHIVYAGGTGYSNPDNCNLSTSFIIPYISSVPEREKAMLSGASMAFSSNKNVKALLSGCGGGIGGQTYPVIHYFHIMQ